MSKALKILLGIATFIQVPVIIGFFVIFFSTASYFLSAEPDALEQNLKWFELSMTIINLVFAVYFGGLALFYIVDAARNPNVEGVRAQWIIGTIMIGPIVTPFYWYEYVWNDGSSRRRSGPLGLNSDD